MLEIFKETFYTTATAAAELIVPIVAIVIIMRLFYGALLGGNK